MHSSISSLSNDLSFINTILIIYISIFSFNKEIIALNNVFGCVHLQKKRGLKFYFITFFKI